MGYGDLVAQAVADAQGDMARVGAAADEILSAIGAVRPWLHDHTWTGQAADAWCGQWKTFYGQLSSLLGPQLDGAESAAVNGARTQAEAMVTQRERGASGE